MVKVACGKVEDYDCQVNSYQELYTKRVDKTQNKE